MELKPTLQDIRQAAELVHKHVSPTPLRHSAALSKLVGAEVYVKYENHHPINVFKIRGAVYKMSVMGEEERARGVVTASTGNHGQAIAYGAALTGSHATIFMPEVSNPEKVESMQNLGAEIVFQGKDFNEALQGCTAYAEENGSTLIHPADQDLVAGVGSMGLEIFQELPDPDVIITPIGQGSSICGNSIVAKSLRPQARMIGVQAELAPSIYLSFKEGRMVETADCNTFAEGMATRAPAEGTFNIIKELVDDIVLVSEEQMYEAIRLYLEKTHNLAEGAGAAPLAAALKIKESLKGEKVVLILSGGNLSLNQLRDILNETVK